MLGAENADPAAATLYVLHVVPRKKKADANEAIVAAELGSVASAVARGAPCPVLLVPLGTPGREDGR